MAADYSPEIDYATPTLQNGLVFANGVQWLQNSELLICPFGFFMSSPAGTQCFRESIITLKLLILKSRTNYVVTSKYSLFRNSYVRDNQPTIFDYTWTLLS